MQISEIVQNIVAHYMTRRYMMMMIAPRDDDPNKTLIAILERIK